MFPWKTRRQTQVPVVTTCPPPSEFSQYSAVLRHEGSHQNHPWKFEDCLHPRSSRHLPGLHVPAESRSFPVFLRHGGGQHLVPGKYSEMQAAMRIKTLF